jgi:hypothetical protein
MAAPSRGHGTRHHLALVMTVLACAAGGCAFAPGKLGGKSPLSPFKPGLETSALEVVFVRYPYELPALNEELWEQVDETAIPAEARQALAQNGMRAGVITGALPLKLEAALSGKISTEDAAAEAASEPASALASEPLVTRRTLHVLPGQRSELLASGVYEALPLLVKDGTGVRGETYAKARCVFAAKARPVGDHRVRLSLLPEVQHGEPRQEFRGGDDGVFRLDASRPTVALEKMAIEVVLSPGQTVVLGARTDRPGSAGHYFFTEAEAGALEQKLLLIRCDGTKYDNLLHGDERNGRGGGQSAL